VTRKLRTSIEDLWAVPAPVFIEVTQRREFQSFVPETNRSADPFPFPRLSDDADHLIPVLKRLFKFKSDDELPILLIGGKKATHLYVLASQADESTRPAQQLTSPSTSSPLIQRTTRSPRRYCQNSNRHPDPDRWRLLHRRGVSGTPFQSFCSSLFS